MSRRIAWIIIVMFIGVGLSVRPAGAQSSTVWTTTADFDGGTYSVSSGNREVNSNTCNLGVSANQIELDSLKGDSFCVDDTDADTFKWTPQSGTTAPTVTHEEVGHGTYHLTTTTAGRRGLVPAATVSGDWDVRVEVTRIQGTTGATRALQVEDVQDVDWDTAGSDGYLYYWSIAATLQLYRVVNAVSTRIGTDTAFTGLTLCMRLTRSGDTFSNYYSSDCDAWTLDETDTFAGMPSAFYPVVLADNTLVTVETEWDDFRLASGTVGSGGFRSSGDWTSPQISVEDGERVSTVAWTETGATAARCVNQIEVRVSAVVQQTFGPGCQTSPLSVSGNLNGAVDVRVYLVGDGAGTSAVLDITVTTAVSGGGGPGGSTGKDWTWRHLAEDLTVQLTVVSPNKEFGYEWVISGETFEGAVIKHQFPYSGRHLVVLRVVLQDGSIYENPKYVQTISLSFVGRYLPVLSLVVVATWFVVLVLAEEYKSNRKRLLGLVVMLTSFGLTFWLIDKPYLTFPLNGQLAVQMFFGMALFVVGGGLIREKTARRFPRSHVAGAMVLIFGMIVLAVTYLAIVPSL